MKKKLLMVLPCLQNGGVERVVFNICNKAEEYEIDIFKLSGGREYYDEIFTSQGCNILRIDDKYHEVGLISKNILLVKEIYRCVSTNKYEIIHTHCGRLDGPILLGAWLRGVKKRISHSHWANTPRRNRKEPIIVAIYRMMIIMFSTNIIGCSKAAIKWICGRETIKKGQVIVNGVDTDKFNPKNYNPKTTKEKYKNLFKQDTRKFIHIGRFSPEKNQIFVLRVFAEITNRLTNSELILVGYGDDEERIKCEIDRLKIRDKVIVLPGNTDVAEVLSISDVLIFPSLFEGLGVVPIEAQIMGLKCFVSDKVPIEVQMGLCTFIPLEKGEKYWGECIVNEILNDSIKLVSHEEVEQYSSEVMVDKIQRIYKITKIK